MAYPHNVKKTSKQPGSQKAKLIREGNESRLLSNNDNQVSVRHMLDLFQSRSNLNGAGDSQ